MSRPWQTRIASLLGDRPEQQDRSLVLTSPDRPLDCLAVLADGMGGRQGGAEAAQRVIDTAQTLFSTADTDDPQGLLRQLCDSAHASIRSLEHTAGNSPASTCVALYLRDNEAHWVHVGDSRLYHFAGRTLVARTTDHTVATLRQRHAEYAAALGAEHDHRLYTCLGGENAMHPEFGASAIGPDDWFVLSSDGLWRYIQPDEISRQTDGGADLGEAADRLAAVAVARAGRGADNTSLILVSRRATARGSGWRRLLPARLRQT